MQKNTLVSQTSTQWTKSLLHLITTMTYPDLIHQFIHAVLSDRAILPLQWAHKFIEIVMFKPELTSHVYQWLDDLLVTPLQFELVWIIPEHIFTQDFNSLFSYGQLYCFSKHPTFNSDHMLWQYTSRSLTSIDGFTLCLMSELIKRQKKTLVIKRVNLNYIHLTLEIDTFLPTQRQPLPVDAQTTLLKSIIIPEEYIKKPMDTKLLGFMIPSYTPSKAKTLENTQDKPSLPNTLLIGEYTQEECNNLGEKIQAARSRLFSHVILSLISLPFIASHVPDNDLVIKNTDEMSIDSFNIHYMMQIIHSLMSYFNNKCTNTTAYHYPEWFHLLNVILCQLHLRKRDDIFNLFQTIGCSCICCNTLKPILLRYVPISYDIATHCDVSTLLLQLYHDSTQDELVSENNDKMLELNNLFADTMSVRMFTQFSNDMNQKKETARLKRQREEELEPWRRNLKPSKT